MTWDRLEIQTPLYEKPCPWPNSLSELEICLESNDSISRDPMNRLISLQLSVSVTLKDNQVGSKHRDNCYSRFAKLVHWILRMLGQISRTNIPDTQIPSQDRLHGICLRAHTGPRQIIIRCSVTGFHFASEVVFKKSGVKTSSCTQGPHWKETMSGIS